jgi:hypothetical protein
MKHHLSILTYGDLVSVLMYQCVQPNTVFTAVFQPYQPISHEKHEQYAALQYVIKQRKRHLCCASLPRRFIPDSRRDDDLPKVSTLVADHLRKISQHCFSTSDQPGYQPLTRYDGNYSGPQLRRVTIFLLPTPMASHRNTGFEY